MQKLTDLQEKKIIELENKWLKHKRLRNKTNNPGHPDFLSMRQREEILDKLFLVIFND